MRLDRHGDVHLITMDSADNRMNPAWIAELHGHLDQVEAADGPAALVVTGVDRFFSNGLDLDWLGEVGVDGAGTFFPDLFQLWGRVLAFPMRTVAAINGHAFAGGAMFSLCFDFRVMRTDRGYWCLPEADLALPLQDPMTAVIKGRLPIHVAHEAIVDGRRYTAEEALAAHIVDRAEPEHDVVPAALSLAQSAAAKDRPNQSVLKEGLYPDLLTTLRSFTL